MQCNMILYGKRHRGVLSMVWRVVGYRAACRHLQVLHQEQEQEEDCIARGGGLTHLSAVVSKQAMVTSGLTSQPPLSPPFLAS